MGIEPTFEAWEAPVLPLNYTRNQLNTPLTALNSLKPVTVCRIERQLYAKQITAGKLLFC